MIAVTDLIIDAMVSNLIAKMRDGVEDLKVSTIRAGRLQDDPTLETGLNLLIHYNTEGSGLTKDNDHQHFTVPAYQIGGGVSLQTYFTIEMIFHHRTNDREVARRNTGILLARLKKTFFEMPLPRHPDTNQPRDDFGEVIIGKEFVGYTLTEGGGRGQFIWKGAMSVKFFTQSSAFVIS